MPTYQYACTDCGDRSEVVQRFTDDPLTDCTVCGGRLRKVFSPVGVVFKGSGFYRTDSRNGSSKAPATGAANGSSAGADKTADSAANTSSGDKPASGSSPGSSSGSSSGSAKESAKAGSA